MRSHFLAFPCVRGRALGTLALTLTACHALSGDTAWAQTPTSAATDSAQALYESGKAKLQEDQAPAALKDFKRALSVAQSDEDLGLTWQLLMAVAYTYREAKEPGFAIEYYRRFLDSTELHQSALTAKWRKRRGLAERDISELEAAANATHGYVTVASTPPGAAILIGDKQAGADQDRVSPFGLYLKPGRYTVTVKLQGYAPEARGIEVAAGKLKPLVFKLSPQARVIDDAAPLAPKVNPTLEQAPGSVQITGSVDHDLVLTYGPWAVVGTGGAALLTGIILTAMSETEKADLAASGVPSGTGDEVKSAYDDWRARSDAADTLGTAAIGLYALSGAAIAGGLAWFFWGTPDDTESTVHAVTPTIELSPLGKGVLTGAAWRF